MDLKLKRSPLLIAIMLSTLSIHNTLGFDLYSHAIAHSSGEAFSTLYKVYELFGIEINRYLLLSDIYLLSTKLYIPFGFTMAVLIILPNYAIYRIIEEDPRLRTGPSSAFFLVITVLASFFYSALSMTILWTIALLASNNRVFILGTLFHPLAVSIALLLVIFSRPKRKIVIIIILTYAIYSIILFSMGIDSATAFRTIDLKLLFLSGVYDLAFIKIKEVAILFISLIIIVIAYKFRLATVPKRTFFRTAFLLFAIGHLILAIATFDKYTLFHTVGRQEDNGIMLCTWLIVTDCEYTIMVTTRAALK